MLVGSEEGAAHSATYNTEHFGDHVENLLALLGMLNIEKLPMPAGVEAETWICDAVRALHSHLMKLFGRHLSAEINKTYIVANQKLRKSSCRVFSVMTSSPDM